MIRGVPTSNYQKVSNMNHRTATVAVLCIAAIVSVTAHTAATPNVLGQIGAYILNHDSHCGVVLVVPSAPQGNLFDASISAFLSEFKESRAPVVVTDRNLADAVLFNAVLSEGVTFHKGAEVFGLIARLPYATAKVALLLAQELRANGFVPFPVCHDHPTLPAVVAQVASETDGIISAIKAVRALTGLPLNIARDLARTLVA